MTPSFSTRTFTLVLFLSLLASAAAQVSDLPQCALSCATTEAQKVGCSPSDAPCLCKNSLGLGLTGFASSVTDCTATTSSGCSTGEQNAVDSILVAMCGVVFRSEFPSVLGTGSASRSASPSLPPPFSLSTSATPSSVSTSASASFTPTSPPSSSASSPPPTPTPTSGAPASSPKIAAVAGSAISIGVWILVLSV